MSTAAKEPVSFPVTPPAGHASPLGEGKFIQTAAMLVIGDEVLNGKTKDSNSNYFAKHCFDLGIELKRIEVVPDEEEDIIEAARRLSKRFDWVISTGGIGPTHDDITYSCLAKAFDQPLVRHEETLRRMTAFAAEKYDLTKQTAEQTAARELMGTLPAGERSEVLFVESQKWVPVVRLDGRFCVYPGIPSLFVSLLHATSPYLPLPPTTSKPFRRLVATKLPESSIAPFLTKLQAEVKEEGIRIGSYPAFGVGVTVSLIGRDLARLKELEKKVADELEGTIVEADAA